MLAIIIVSGMYSNYYSYPSVSRKGDSALLLPSNQQVAHECNVEHVAKEWVVLKITDTAKQAW